MYLGSPNLNTNSSSTFLQLNNSGYCTVSSEAKHTHSSSCNSLSTLLCQMYNLIFTWNPQQPHDSKPRMYLNSPSTLHPAASQTFKELTLTNPGETASSTSCVCQSQLKSLA